LYRNDCASQEGPKKAQNPGWQKVKAISA